MTKIGEGAGRANVNRVPGGGVPLHGTGAPVDGVTGAGNRSRMYLDEASGILYLNQGTLEAPEWAEVPVGGGGAGGSSMAPGLFPIQVAPSWDAAGAPWYLLGRSTMAGLNVTLQFNGDQLLAYPFRLARASRLIRLGFAVAVSRANTAGRLGIYDSDPASFSPTARLLDGGEKATDTVGYKDAVVDLALEAGKWYWLVWASSQFGGIAPTLEADAIADQELSPMGAQNDSQRNSPNTIIYKNVGYGALPANFPVPDGVGTIARPRVYARFSA